MVIIMISVFIGFKIQREMYHAFHWHHDKRFFSPMAFSNDGSPIFIRDCVEFLHPTLNTPYVTFVKLVRHLTRY